MNRGAHSVLAQVSLSYSEPKGTFPRVTHPSATNSEEFVRLACVRPAASVRSEPGSNSQVELTSDLSLKTTEAVLALVLRILLTSSHVIDPKTDAWYLFKKTADSQCRMMTSKGHRKNTAACVSLSISTMSKTQNRLGGPTCLAPRRRRRRRFRDRRTSCQPLFSEISQTRKANPSNRKKPPEKTKRLAPSPNRRFD